MEAASERRDPQVTRVPLDDVLVDLYPEGLDESFPADAIDVGLGGLAMRSAVLPDVGSKLSCSFRSPEDGGTVAAEAEVVWAADSGPNTGQFGLRFTALDQADAERIAELVDAWHSSLGAISVANDIDSLAEDPSGARRVSLRLDGVGPAVETELVHTDSDVMIVEQPLPFLTIGKGVDSGGRRGFLESVDLRLDGDTPRLMLTVLFAEAGSSTLAEARAAAAGAAAPALPETLDESVLEPRVEAQASSKDLGPVVAREIDARTGSGTPAPLGGDSLDDYADEEEEALLADGSLGDSSVHGLVDSPDSIGDSVDDSVAEGLRDPSAHESLASSEERSAPKARAADPLLSELKANPGAVVRQALGRVLPLWVKVRAWAMVAWAKVGPWIRIAGARCRAFGVRCWTTVRSLRGPRTSKRTQRRPQQPQRQTRAPRRQARPGERARSAPPQEPAPRELNVRRVAIVGGVVIVLGILGSMAFASSSAGSSTPPIKAPLPEPEPIQAALPPLPMDPELGDEGSPEAAMAQPEGGPLDEPSFPAMPTVGDAQPLAFGEAHVPGGREFRLRLSVPPTALRGEPTSDGFKVTLDGSNAIDGARRIGATHPRVAVASIMNQGERAELTIRFAAGANPAYRVEARGDALLVTIGR